MRLLKSASTELKKAINFRRLQRNLKQYSNHAICVTFLAGIRSIFLPIPLRMRRLRCSQRLIFSRPWAARSSSFAKHRTPFMATMTSRSLSAPFWKNPVGQSLVQALKHWPNMRAHRALHSSITITWVRLFRAKTRSTF
ncbi:hypothetical protein D3C80_1650570 [compost metagenome]